MKRRLLAFLLAFVMTFSLVPVNTFAAEADAAALYTNITTESGENVTVEYVETVVGEAAWGESINTPYYHVTIPEGTEKVLLTYPESVNLVLSGDDTAGFFYRNTYPGQSTIDFGGALTVATNNDGSKTVTIPVENFMLSTDGSVAVGMAYYVDEENQSAAEFFDFTYAAPTHAVTLTPGDGYTLTGEATVEDGKDYSFTVTIADDYEMEDNFVVKANGETLTAGESGSYTVENVTADLTITVEGVVKKQAAGHAVTLTPGEGYTLTGEATAEDGKDYTFTVTVSEGYDAANMVVKVNGEEVTAVDGVYTVEKVSANLTITVEGVTEKPAVWTASFDIPEDEKANIAIGGEDDWFNDRITFGTDKDTKFESVEILIRFNPETTQLHHVMPQGLTQELDNEAGTLKLSIGESGSGVSNDMILRECTYLLAFAPKALGDATVTMEYFKVDGKDLLTAPVALARTIGYKVNWTEDASYTVTGEKYAAVDGTYTFTVAANEGYDGTNMVVKVNDAEVTAVDGKYTVEKVSSDLTITVSGVKKIIIGLSALRFGSTDSIRSAKYFDMTPSFDPAVKEYTMLVPDTTNAVYVWATRGADLTSKAKITAAWTSMSTGKASTTTITSGSSSGKNLSGFNIASAESNTLTITVTDDGSTDVYTVKTVRIDPSLTKLALDGVKVNETFSATKKTYTAMTTKDSVTVLATPRGEDYTVTYNGETSNVIPLSAGENKIEIVVTNKDGYTNSYNLTVTKADHSVTIPTDESYLVTGKEAAMDGADYTFKVEVDYRYEAGEDFAVKVNGETVTGEKGTYTVKNVTTDLVITVEGVTKKVLKPVTVYFSFSHDDKFESCEQSGQTVALKKVTVPYFDLALYGLEDFYFASEDYGPASGDPTGGPGSALDPGTKEFAYGKITMLHLFLYATEVYYLGIDPADAGKGYLADNGMGTDIFNYSGSTGSIFLQNIWNYDLNLNYYLNYEYPLASAGWGSTCDQILLRDGDIVTLGHFTDWSFFNDTTSIFNYIVADKTDPVQGDKIKLELYHAGADMYGTYNTAHTLIDYSPSVYCTPVNDIVSGDVTTWQYVGNAEADGSLVVDTSTLAPGEYIFALAGQPGKENPGVICSTPGGIRLTIHEKPVVKGDINGDGVINSTDVMALFNAINSGDDLDAAVADVNGDGVIDARDVMALYNIIKSDN